MPKKILSTKNSFRTPQPFTLQNYRIRI